MAIATDLTGRTFGKLTVLRRAPNRGKAVQWECECACGRLKPIDASNLKKGHILSCGCHRKYVLSGANEARKDNFANQRFGRLVVKERNPGGGKNSEWRCVCDCGGETVVRGSDLKNNRMQFCSRTCSLRGPRTIRLPDELVGQTFGQLKVLHRLPRKEGSNAAWWECECLLCGKLAPAAGNQLRKGRKGSCGCAFLNRVVVRSRKVRGENGDYVKHRRRKDIGFALGLRVRAHVRFCLKRAGTVKTKRLEALLGYTIADLEARLRETMPAGYSWDDFLVGRLHIDHIRPLSSFTITGEECPAFREAWALSNLQLLTGPDNWAKSDRLDWAA